MSRDQQQLPPDAAVCVTYKVSVFEVYVESHASIRCLWPYCVLGSGFMGKIQVLPLVPVCNPRGGGNLGGERRRSGVFPTAAHWRPLPAGLASRGGTATRLQHFSFSLSLILAPILLGTSHPLEAE